MPHKPADLKKVMEATAAPELELQFRPMFGGISAYARGRMFCSLSDAGLALKLPAAEYEELLKVRGARPLQYEPSMPPSKTYVVVPDSLLKDRKMLGAWIARSASAALAAPLKKPRKKPVGKLSRRG